MQSDPGTSSFTKMCATVCIYKLLREDTILIVAWRAHIYHIWRERNGRIHGQIGKTPVQIFELIQDDLRTRLTRLRNINATYVNRQLCNRWRIQEVC